MRAPPPAATRGSAIALTAVLLLTVPAPAAATPRAPARLRAADVRAAAVGPPRAPTRHAAWVARVVAPTTARAAPSPQAAPVLAIGTAARWNGGPVRLLVLGSRRAADGGRWLRVALPRRPNETSGWIPADVAVTSLTRWRIEVSLRARSITLLHDARVVRRSRVVVGRAGTPTPRGLFAVDEVVRQVPADGFLGPWALHLTAFSEVLEDYGGGPGRVAVHGRDGASLADPLGSARSHGCVRVTDATVRLLAQRALPGTPVRIR